MKKRFKITVTKKNESGLIQLGDIDYFIPKSLIDKKYPTHGKKGFPLHPLIITKEQYERTSGHYMKFKDLEYKRIILKVQGDEEKERILSIKYAYEDCYEKLDDMDYYRKWFQHLNNIDE